MYVSLNTVKTHVKAIYRKFGVASRTEAVAIARSHGLAIAVCQEAGLAQTAFRGDLSAQRLRARMRS